MAHKRCIRFMHLRLQSYLPFMCEPDSCCIALSWGEDVKDFMYDSEFDEVDKSHIFYVKSRMQEHF